MINRIFNYRSILFLSLILLIISQTGCDQLGPLKRTNSYDPSGTDFKPESPDTLYASIKGDSVKLSWLDQSNYEKGYLVERSLGKNKEYQILKKLPPNSEAYTDIVEGAPFWIRYRVIPYVQFGDSLRGHSVETPYLPFIPFNKVKPKLKVLSETKVFISWPLLYKRNVNYVVDRLITPNESQGINNQIVTPLDTLSGGINTYVDSTELSSSLIRGYSVIPIANGEVGPNSQVSYTGNNIGIPSSFHLIKNGTTGDRARLSWYASSMSDGFNLEIRPIGGNWRKLVSLGSTARSYLLTLPDTNKSYSFRVSTITSDYTKPITISYDSTLVLLKHLNVSEGIVNKVALNHAENIVYYAYEPNTNAHLVAWNWKQNRKLFSISRSTTVQDIKITPDDSKLLVATGSISDGNGNLQVIDAKTGVAGRVLLKGRTYLTAISPNGQNYVSLHPIPYFQIRNIDTNALVSQDTLIDWGGGYDDLAFDPTAPYLAIMRYDQYLEIHNLKTNTEVRVGCDYWTGCLGLTDYDSKGKYLFDGGRILDPINGTVVRVFHFPHSTDDAKIGPMDRIYAIWHYNYGVGMSIYNIDGSLWRNFETTEGEMIHLAASDSGKLVVTITSSGIDVWTPGKRWQVISN